jgi:hypothetical protein
MSAPGDECEGKCGDGAAMGNSAERFEHATEAFAERNHFRALTCADITKKRAQCGQAQVACSYTIATLLFEVSQKGDQPSGRQIGKRQLIGSLAAIPLQKVQ